MPTPLLFPITRHLPFGPQLVQYAPTPPTMFRVTGVTRDSTGAVLAACTVKMYRTADDVLVDTVTSDGSGVYEFRSGSQPTNYYLVAYKPGAPDVEGTTANTLTAVG